MNNYEKYPHIEKSLIDFIMEKSSHKNLDYLLNDENYVKSMRNTPGYAFYNFNRACNKLCETIKKELFI